MREALAAERNLGLRVDTTRSSKRRSRFAELCDDYLRVPEHDLARVRERYVDRARSSAARSTSAASSARRSRCSSGTQRRARTYQDGVPLHPRRRVPGHERRPGAAAGAARRRARQRLLRRRRGPVDLRLPRRRDRQHARLRRALAGRAPLRPADQLPLGAADRRARHERDPPQRRHAPRQGAARRRRTAKAELVGRTFRHAAEEADWIAREIAAPAAGRRRRSARSRCSPAR